MNPLLRVSGSGLVNGDGETVRLTGFGLGGWMNMENFITGYPGTEDMHRRAMRKVLGGDVYDAFFDRFLEVFFTEEDAKYIASLGVNCVRIAVNYRHFFTDAEPDVLREEGFRLLDRAIGHLAAYGVYSVIDLHATPGAQNQRWHSDNPTHLALLWQYRVFQDQVVALWEEFARRYRDNPWIAGYNPLNEPGDASGQAIGPFYDRVCASIRSIDPDHVIFLDGNRHGTAFDMFSEPAENTVYTLHDYALAGFADSGRYPGMSRGEYVDRDFILRKFLERAEYMRRTQTPIWVGEFGPVYSGEHNLDEHRYRVLEDQLEIYREYGAGWSLWTYKDIGLQGVQYAAPDSPYVTLIGPVREKKDRLGTDVWGGVDEGVRDVLEPIERLVAREFPDYDPAPFGQKQWIATLIRHIMLAEPLSEEFASVFTGITEEQAVALADSFRIGNTIERTRLADVIRAGV